MGSDSYHTNLEFRDGALYVIGDPVTRVRAWPELVVETRREDGPSEIRDFRYRDQLYESVGCRPVFWPEDYVFANGGWWYLGDNQGSFEWSVPQHEHCRGWGQYCWECLDATLPEDLRQKVKTLDVDWLSATALIQNAPEVCDLQPHDPLLAAALARHWEFPAVGREDWEGVRRQVTRKRRDILEWLGYPASEPVVNALRRHRVWESKSPILGMRVREFFDVMQDPLYGPELLRLEVTRSELVSSLFAPVSRQWLTGALLRDILQASRKRMGAAACEIEEINAMVSCGLIAPSLAFVRTHRRRMRKHEEWDLSEIADLPFLRWPTPVRGGVEALTSVHQLILEGREMQHCAGSMGYVTQALEGQLAVFRVISPVRATLALGYGGGGWCLSGLNGYQNEEISPEDRREILSAFPSWIFQFG